MDNTNLDQDSFYVSNLITDYIPNDSKAISYTERKELAMSNYKANKIAKLKSALLKELADDVLFTNSEYQSQILNRIKMVDLMESNDVDYETIEYSAYSLITDEELTHLYDFKPEVIMFDAVSLKRNSSYYTNKEERSRMKDKLSKFILN